MIQPVKRIIGVDCGALGAFALYVDNRLDRVVDMPIVEVVRGGSTKKQVSAQGVAAIIKELAPTHAFVEKVGAMPNQGVSSMFAFGRAAGVIEGCLAALSVPVTYITPQAWMKATGCGKGKDAIRHRAMELHPDDQHLFKRVKDSGRADASMIAYYGTKTL
jgi:crossover junction endodeoxyribonuclease RuvC